MNQRFKQQLWKKYGQVSQYYMYQIMSPIYFNDHWMFYLYKLYNVSEPLAKYFKRYLTDGNNGRLTRFVRENYFWTNVSLIGCIVASRMCSKSLNTLRWNTIILSGLTYFNVLGIWSFIDRDESIFWRHRLKLGNQWNFGPNLDKNIEGASPYNILEWVTSVSYRLYSMFDYGVWLY